MVTGTPSLSASACTISAAAIHRLQPGPSTLTSFMDIPWVSVEQRIEQEADCENAGPDNADEDRNESWAQHLAQDDHLRKRQRDHRHHEGEHGSERRPL